MRTTEEQAETLAEVAEMAHKQPVVTQVSDLGARILENRHGIEIIDGFQQFCKLFESPNHVFSGDVVIRDTDTNLPIDSSLTTYSSPPVINLDYSGTPYTAELNTKVDTDWLSWRDVEETTLRQSRITDYIVTNATNADVIVLVIVDGLSYQDWINAGYDATPVYVDCPTVTECGYPNVVNGGPRGTNLSVRLYQQGFTNRYAFTYWKKDENDLTERLHKPFSENDIEGNVQDFSDVITHLRHKDWYNGPVYLQITLTGPERVAHQLKENPNVEAEVNTIKRKLENLAQLLSSTVPSFRIFATADHGMLWRMEAGDDFDELDGDWEHYERRCITDPDPDLSLPHDHGWLEEWNGDRYFRLDYPYLFSGLRSNEPGTHGGLSFQESLVPLIELR